MHTHTHRLSYRLLKSLGNKEDNPYKSINYLNSCQFKLLLHIHLRVVIYNILTNKTTAAHI